ncbi:hypothetical protein KCU65_g16, partial [Aureobasidium melanogenum]
MAPSATAAAKGQNVLLVGNLLGCILPVVCRRMPRSDKGRGNCRRHVDNVHRVWRMSSKTCRPSAFELFPVHDPESPSLVSVPPAVLIEEKVDSTPAHHSHVQEANPNNTNKKSSFFETMRDYRKRAGFASLEGASCSVFAPEKTRTVSALRSAFTPAWICSRKAGRTARWKPYEGFVQMAWQHTKTNSPMTTSCGLYRRQAQAGNEAQLNGSSHSVK